MSIRSKLFTAFTLSILVTTLTCITIYWQLQNIEKKYSTTLDTSLPQTYLTADTSRYIMSQATLVQNYLLGKDTLAAIENRRNDLNTALNDLEQWLASETTEYKTLIANLKAKVLEVNAGFDQAILLADTTDQATASAYYVEQAGMRVIESMDLAVALSAKNSELFDNEKSEPARAGEHGKGFAVVADEVRKLAEESNRSASQIGSLTSEIQRDTKNVELAIQESLQNVEQGVNIIDLAGDSFNQIVHAIGQMKVQIEDVSSMTEQISASSEQVTASVSEISRDADLTYLNAQQAYESSEQQLSSLSEISSVATDLSNRAQELQQIVANSRL